MNSKINKTLRQYYRKCRRFVRHRGKLRKALLSATFKRNAGAQRGLLSQERSERLLQSLHVRIAAEYATPVQAPVRQMFPVKQIAAAAIVIILATASGAYLYWRRTPVAAVSKPPVRDNTLITYINKELTPQSVTLPDSSVIKIWPGSGVSYYDQFAATSRKISLNGKAIFTVTKDTARPFTVYAADIGTTALGTVFMVNTLEEPALKVQLFEGKVRIRAVDEKIAMKEVYLKAGEQFEINKTSGDVCISPINQGTEMASGQNTKKGINKNNRILEFNQTPLTEVLASVGERYHVRFTFKEGDFNKMYVTGKFLPSDSLPVVLSMLGTVYRLNFKRENNTISVTGK